MYYSIQNCRARHRQCQLHGAKAGKQLTDLFKILISHLKGDPHKTWVTLMSNCLVVLVPEKVNASVAVSLAMLPRFTYTKEEK